MGRDCADVAATLHAHLCEHDWHGYDWGARWGDGEGTCEVEVGGETFSVEQGDRDCSSSVIECWREALRGTAYEGALDGATYTGNMRSVLVGSGLFEWKPMSFTAQRGDVYLSESSHTAMCQSAVPDVLSEFSINENGGCYGGQVGDQTGRESSVHAYYDFPWDGILHYNGKADGGARDEADGKIRYRVFTREHGWLGWMRGLVDEQGDPEDFAGDAGCWIYDAQFEGVDWYRLERADGSEALNGGGNTASPVTGVVLPTGVYQAHWLGAKPGWGKWECGDSDGGAGKDRDSPLDMVRVR